MFVPLAISVGTGAGVVAGVPAGAAVIMVS